MVNFINCGKREFIYRTKEKDIYCFGAGRYLVDFFGEHYDIEITGVIDNYRYMDDISISVNQKSVKIISVDEFKKICDNNCAIIITCAAFDDIIYQLDSLEELNGIDCYIEFFIRHCTEHQELLVDFSDKSEIIPKKIHYCWFGGSELPDKYKKNIESWKKYCPDYEIIRWDESNYDVYKNRYMSQAYDSKKWAFVTDYARIDIIYQEGGIYFDTDVELLKPFDVFLCWRMFCGFESDKFVALGLGFGAVKKEPILKNILTIYDNMNFIQEDGVFDMTTCPIIQSKVMKQCGFKMNGQFQVKDEVAVYPKEFFAPLDYLRGLGEITNNTYSVHHYDATWTNANHILYRQELEKKIARVNERKRIKESKKNINQFQIWEYINESNIAGGKAPTDVKDILSELGYYIIGIHPYRGEMGSDIQKWTFKRMEEEWENCYKAVLENSILLLQYPFCQEQKIRNKILYQMKKEKNVQILVFIHDVESLRKIFLDSYRKTEFQFILKIADVMIVHNERMLEYFIQLGVDKKRLVNLQIFDYLCKETPKKKKFDKSITIAGNLQTLKSPYIGKLQELAPLNIHLYGPNYDKAKENISNIIYHGSFPSDQIPQRLEGGFGLVWDGNSLDTCSGPTGEYLKYNNPHKLSLYLAAGLPVIIWKEAAEATFVKTHGIGFTVDSLFEIQEILDNMSEKKYAEYQNAVINISEKLLKGEYTKHAIKQAEEILQIHL